MGKAQDQKKPPVAVIVALIVVILLALFFVFRSVTTKRGGVNPYTTGRMSGPPSS